MISLRGNIKAAAQSHQELVWWTSIVGSFAVATGYYYWSDVWFLPAPSPWATFLQSSAHHEIGFIMFALPVVLAAVRFYVRGAVIVSVAATLSILPHSFATANTSDQGFRLASFAVITLLLGVLVGNLLKNRRLLLAQQADLERFISRSLQVQEQEKQYLARELHDETAQQLVDVLHEIDEVYEAARHDELAAVRLRDLRELVEDVLDGTRRFMQGLRPPQLDELGLVPSLRFLCEEVDSDYDSVSMGFVVDESKTLPKLSKDAELAVYRMAQEGLTNVRRHSGAKHATLSVEPLTHGLRLVIEDDGEGFDTRPLGDLARQGKFGIIGLSERARLAGGTARIESTRGLGTKVTVEVPETGSL